MASIAKHLHGRGEDPREPFGASEDLGNTSTDVEKTSTRTTFPLRVRKHLHGRGEDTVDISVSSYDGETPPRTWRRPERSTAHSVHQGNTRRYVSGFPRCEAHSVHQGNTSTDVEKTTSFCFPLICGRKHLHGRGEDDTRARKPQDALRNTSADVEKTTCWLWHPAVGWKHLHGRGENSKPSPFLLVHPEKHLHGRGEDAVAKGVDDMVVETPPRTWRRPSASESLQT